MSAVCARRAAGEAAHRVGDRTPCPRAPPGRRDRPGLRAGIDTARRAGTPWFIWRKRPSRPTSARPSGSSPISPCDVRRRADAAPRVQAPPRPRRAGRSSVRSASSSVRPSSGDRQQAERYSRSRPRSRTPRIVPSASLASSIGHVPAPAPALGIIAVDAERVGRQVRGSSPRAWPWGSMIAAITPAAPSAIADIAGQRGFEHLVERDPAVLRHGQSARPACRIRRPRARWSPSTGSPSPRRSARLPYRGRRATPCAACRARAPQHRRRRRARPGGVGIGPRNSAP